MFTTAKSENKLLRPKRRFPKFIFGAVIAVILLSGLVYFVFYSPYLKVRRTEVSGSNLVSPEFLVKQMAALIIGKNYVWQMIGEDNILFWKFSKKPRIFSTLLPSVASIDLSVDLWKRSLNFSVKERKAIGVWCRAERECYAFDESGVIFGEAPASRGVLILRIDDESGTPIVLGRPALPHGEWFANILANVSEVASNNFQIVSIKVKSLDLREWEISTSAGITMLFSFNFTPDNLGKVLESLKERLAGSKIKVLDFRVPNRIYYR